MEPMTTQQQIAKDLLATWLAQPSNSLPPGAASDAEKLGTWLGKAYLAALKAVEDGLRSK